MRAANLKTVEWNEGMSVGVSSMDSQHQTMLRMINDIYTGRLYCGRCADARFISYAHRILDFIRYHYIAEENFLEKIRYPRLDEHRKQHRILIRGLLNQIKKFDAGLPRAPIVFVNNLQNEILTHLAVTDKKYAAFAKHTTRHFLPR